MKVQVIKQNMQQLSDYCRRGWIGMNHLYRRIAKKYQVFIRKYSIKKRLLLLELMQIFIVILWSIFSISNSVIQTSTTVDSQNYEEMNSVMKSFETDLKNLDVVSKYPTFQSYNVPGIYTYLSNKEYYKDKMYQYYEEVLQNCHQLNMQYPSVDLISICDNTGSGIYVKSMSNLYSTAQNQSTQKWFQQTMKQKGGALYWDSSALANTDFSIGQNQVYISRAIVNVDSFKTVGLILASADLNGLFEDFESKKIFPEQHIGIFDKSGNKIFGDLQDKDIINVLSSITKRESSVNWHNSTSGKLSTGWNSYSFSKVLQDYTCVISTPNSCLVSFAGQSIRGIVILWILLILSVLFSTKQIIGSIVQPLFRLSDACQKLKQGNFTTQVPDSGNDEISDYVQSFNSMTQKLNTLITEGYKKDIQATQLELQMLRNQINPHFLYNTLESIRVTASLNDQAVLSEMAALLGKTMRYGISSPAEIVTVRTELENLQDYVHLQKLRYGDKIQFILCIADELMDKNIIKVLFQPLVENAIYHGIDKSPNNGVINILGYMKEKTLVFQVVDNGLGIAPQRLKLLNDYINGKNDCFKSIGLKNVNRRIQLFYGKEYGVTIQSAVNQGTAVTVTLPNNI